MRTGFTVATLVLLSAFAFGQSSEPNQNIENRRTIELPNLKHKFRPKLTLQRALKRAEDHIKKNKIDVSSYYLLEARMIQYGGEKDVKEPRWFFVWVNESGAAGDHVEITVSMEGKVARHPSM